MWLRRSFGLILAVSAPGLVHAAPTPPSLEPGQSSVWAERPSARAEIVEAIAKIENAEKVGDWVKVNIAASHAARLLEEAGDIPGAITFAQIALEAHVRVFDLDYLPEITGEENPFQHYLRLLDKTGDHARAADWRKRMQQAKPLLAQIQNIENQYYRDKRGPEANLALAEKQVALAAAYPGAQSHAFANALTWKAISLTEAGRPEEAIPVMDQAILSIQTALGDRSQRLAQGLRLYADLLIRMGRLSDARAVIQQAQGISAEVGEDVSEDYLDLYLAVGEGPRALEIANRQLAEGEQEEARKDRQREEAKARIARGEVPDVISPFDGLIQPLIDKAKVHLLVSDAELGESYARRALARMKFLGTPIDNNSWYDSRVILGRTLLAQKKADNARAELELARKYLSNQPGYDVEETEATAVLLARAHLMQPAPGAKPASLLQPVIDRLQKNRLSGAGSLGRVTAADTAGGSRRELLKLYADALWARGGSASSTSAEAFTVLQGAMDSPATQAVAKAAARASAAARGSNFETLAGEREQLIARWRDVDTRLALLVGKSGDEANEAAPLRTTKSELEKRFEAVDDMLRTGAPEFHAFVQPSPIDGQAMARLLAQDEAALMIVPSEFGTHSMLVTSEGIRWHRSNLAADEITAAVTRLRRDLDPTGQTRAAVQMGGAGAKRVRAYDRQTAQQLYAELIEPLQSALGGKRTMYIAADGALSSLPLGVLVTRAPEGADSDPAALRSTEWLADRFALVQIPSFQSLQFMRQIKSSQAEAKSAFAGFGDPVLAGGPAEVAPPAPSLRAASLFSAARPGNPTGLADVDQIRKLTSLPQTSHELERLRAALGAPPASIHLRQAATEAVVKAASLSDERVIAFATHGLLAGELDGVAEPGLVFTPPERASKADDGLLTASEITALKLNADWVILSACNTAAGDEVGAPGLSGLSRAFFYAGARNLLASHWPVRDDVAALITVDTITRLRDNPKINKAEALQQAMQAIRNSPNDPSKAHPSAWAPFVLIGDAGQGGQ